MNTLLAAVVPAQPVTASAQKSAAPTETTDALQPAENEAEPFSTQLMMAVETGRPETPEAAETLPGESPEASHVVAEPDTDTAPVALLVGTGETPPTGQGLPVLLPGRQLLAASSIADGRSAGLNLTVDLNGQSSAPVTPGQTLVSALTAVQPAPEVSQEELAQLLATAPAAEEASDVDAREPDGLSPVTRPASRPAAPGAPSLRVNAAPGQPQFASELAERVVYLNSRNLSVAHLNLNPPELGPLEVRIQIVNEAAQVAFASQHAEVREALEMNEARLRELFERAGLELADSAVGHGFAGNEGDQSGEGADQGAAPADDETPVTRSSPASLLDVFA